MNPADYKHFGPGQVPEPLPLTVGYEVAGIIAALEPDTEIASRGGAVGDEVVAFQVSDGYASSRPTASTPLSTRSVSMRLSARA